MSGIVRDLSNPIVIDNGSATRRAGFAGGVAPQVVFPTLTGRHHQLSTPSGKENVKTVFIGEEVLENSNMLRLRCPIEFGMITSWDDMELIWRHILHDQLHATLNDHPILLTEPILSPRSGREKATMMFFEEFNVPAMYLAIGSVLSLNASGRSTGIVFDSGYTLTHVVPVYEGYALPYTLRRPDGFGGRDLSDYLTKLLTDRGLAIVTTAERRAVDEMKEKFCYVATDFDVELASARDCTKIEKHYTLPDGQVLTMGYERFRCPEALFKPELSGLQQPGVVRILFDTIERCDTDIRQALYSNIVLSGGNSMFPGLADRMKNEIVALAPTETDVQVIAPLDRHNAAWIGGSMLSSLSTFQNMWITKDEYDEYGPSIVQKKCF